MRHHRKKKKNPKQIFPYNHTKNTSYNNRQIKHSIDRDCEWWVDYDRRGNITHKRTVYNFTGIEIEYWVEYDNSNHEVHFKRNDGFQYWCIYNKDGNISKYWDTDGYEVIYSYYKGVVYKKDNLGNKVRKEYDKTKHGYLTIHNF